VGLAAFFVIFVSTSVGADEWDRYKGNCDTVMASYSTVTMLQLKRCVSLWIAYAQPAGIRANKKQKLTNAFQSLYQQGIDTPDEEAEYLAVMAAGRLNVRLKLVVRKEPGSGSVTIGDTATRYEVADVTASRRRRFDPPAVSKANQKKAARHVRKGVGYFKKGNRKAALTQYLKALRLDPGNLSGMFNAAAEYAFKQDGRKSVELLQKLVDIGTEKAFKYVGAARTDPDFDRIHDYIPYKRVSGYARIKLVNSLGELGDLEIYRIARTLKKLNHVIATEGVDKEKNRESPVIWFKDHSAHTAYLIKDVIVHPGTLMTKIDWDTEFDIIISWGTKVVTKDGTKRPVKDYTKKENLDPDKQMSKLRRRHEEILRKPDDVSRKVNNVVGTPKRGIDNVKRTIDRTDRTLKRIDKTYKKIKNPFK
jgi:tetratricopeptide (TPR) repeat protein